MLKFLKKRKKEHAVSEVSTFLSPLLTRAAVQIPLVSWDLLLLLPVLQSVMCSRGELPPLIWASFPREGPYDFGGVLTNSNRDIINGDALHKRNQAYKEMHWWVCCSLSAIGKNAPTPLEFTLLGAVAWTLRNECAALNDHLNSSTLLL